MTALNTLGEQEIIKRLSSLLPISQDSVVNGIGDDVAVIHLPNMDNDFLLTSDAVIEGIHFLSETEPERIGHKAIGRALSDIASTGGTPLWALINLTAPADMDIEHIEGIYRGAQALAKRYGLSIIGGDTTQVDTLQLHVFAIGQLPHGTALLRSDAKEHDLIYVTGSLGGSIQGKHLDFTPRIKEGVWLRENNWAHAMIDLSDGLATDLRHILKRSRKGAIIHQSQLPISEAAKICADDKSPLDHALTDGEDYELLFTIAAETQSDFESAWQKQFNLPCTHIGEITGESEHLFIKTNDNKTRELTENAFEHFKQ